MCSRSVLIKCMCFVLLATTAFSQEQAKQKISIAKNKIRHTSSRHHLTLFNFKRNRLCCYYATGYSFICETLAPTVAEAYLA